METVLITHNGTLHRDDGRSSRAPGNEMQDILACLSDRARLDADFSLRSFFALVARHPEIKRMSPFLVTAEHDAAACPEQGCTTPDFTELVFAKTVELTGAPGEPEMNVFTTFRGVLPDGDTPAKTGEIRFHRLDALLDMPVRLGRLRHVVFGDRTSMLECDTTFSLFEIIEGIAWELGFQGGSQQCSLRR